MDTRRRTLASDPSHSNQQPPHSSIPIPSSAIKGKSALRSSSSQTNLRQSVAPGGMNASAGGPHRMSVAPAGMGIGMSASGAATGGAALSASQQGSQHGDGGAQAGPARRSTMMASRTGVNAPEGNLLSSGNRRDGGMYGKTSIGHMAPTPGTARRTSSYSSIGRQSVAGPGASSSASASGLLGIATARIAIDPRPDARLPSTKKLHADNVAEYLASRCPYQFSAKSFLSPTLKDFQVMFKYIYQDLDVGFVWGKSFEADCQQAIRDMKYPYPDTIGKTALGAPGSPNTWGTLLALMGWMVELAKSLQTWSDPEVVADPLMMPTELLPVDLPMYLDRCVEDYNQVSFQAWMDGANDWPDVTDALQARIEAHTAHLAKDTRQKEIELQRLENKLTALNTEEPPLKRLQSTNASLLDDKSKFIAYLNTASAKQEKMQGTLEKAKVQLEAQMRTIEEYKIEHAEYEAQVRAQNLTPEEVIKMNNDRTHLQGSLTELELQKAELGRKVGEGEMSIARQQDALEELIERYKALGERLHLIGGNRKMAPIHIQEYLSHPDIADVDFALNIHSEGMANAKSDLTIVGKESERMKGSIRPALQKYDELVRNDHFAQDARRLGIKGEWDGLTSKVDMTREQAMTMDIKVKMKDQEVERERLAYQLEMEQSRKGVDDYEAQVNEINMSGLAELRATDGAIDALKLERSELEHKIRHLREKLVTEINSHMEIMVKAKEHASSKLMEVKNFAKSSK